MVTYNGKEVQIKRSTLTRGMTLTVTRQGDVVVYVNPMYTFSEKTIQEFVNKHKRFVKNRQEKRKNVVMPGFDSLENINLLGEDYLVFKDKNVKKFALEDGVLFVPEKWDEKQSFAFFSELLLSYIEPLTKSYSEKFGLKYSSVTIFSGIGAWGTYNRADNSVRYNICLIFLPKECSEYLVAHELCHYIRAQHGKEFWAEVKKVFPEYEKPKAITRSYNRGIMADMLKLLAGNGND